MFLLCSHAYLALLLLFYHLYFHCALYFIYIYSILFAFLRSYVRCHCAPIPSCGTIKCVCTMRKWKSQTHKWLNAIQIKANTKTRNVIQETKEEKKHLQHAMNITLFGIDGMCPRYVYKSLKKLLWPLLVAVFFLFPSCCHCFLFSIFQKLQFPRQPIYVRLFLDFI